METTIQALPPRQPPVAEDRLRIDGGRLGVYALKGAFSQATAYVPFKSNDFIARPAALVPPPWPISYDTKGCAPPMHMGVPVP